LYVCYIDNIPTEIGLAQRLTQEVETINNMFGLKLSPSTKQPKYHKYFKCDRCGYITIVRNSYCPICTKDGHLIKMK